MKVVALLLLAGCATVFDLEHVVLVDAGPADATFDPARGCPMEYQLALFPGSHYRFTSSSLALWDSSDDCNDDAQGVTHLAAAQTRAELDALIAAVVQSGIGTVWTGHVQAPGATTPSDRWIWTTGESVDPALWAPGEPNDTEGIEDTQEQAGDIAGGVSGLLDYNQGFGKRALCECDGREIASEAKTAIDLLRL